MTIQQLKNEIRANIYENGNGHITGQILQDVLLDMVSKVEEAEALAGRDGEDGIGVRSVTTAATTNGKRVTINLTDGRSYPFEVKNGLDGAKGADGRDGSDGRDGANGANGRDGRDGRNGIDGQDGRDGAQGPAGARGLQGPAGAAGSKGEKGDRGERGLQGPAGSGGYGDQGLFDSLERELIEFKNEVSGRMQSISSSISTEAANAVASALRNLNLTTESMNQLRTALNAAAQNAQDALNKARALENLIGDGGQIDMDALSEALQEIQQFRDWLDDIGDGFNEILADYNDNKAGLIGRGYDVSRGLFTWFGESINTLSGTVGTVRRDMDGSQGLIRDMATWYDESRSGYTSAWTAIDAMNGRIENIVEDVTESATTRAINSIDGRLGEISQMIESMSGFSGEVLTQLSSRMSAAEAAITNTINRQNGLSGSLVSIGTRMDGVQGSVSTAVTVANNALTTATRMANTWNQESGILQTVADLTINKDDAGHDIFWYINKYDGNDSYSTGETAYWVDASGEERTLKEVRPESTIAGQNYYPCPEEIVQIKVRAFYRGHSADGRTFFSSKSAVTQTVSQMGKIYFENVYPDYLTGAFSYINQRTSSVEFGVSSGQVLAAFNMAATPDGSKINMTADRVNIDGDVFARSFSAITANLGGVKMGYGVISAGSRTGDYWELKEDGTGKFTGDIVARSLKLGSNTYYDMPSGGGSDPDALKKGVVVSGAGGSLFCVSDNGLLRAENAIINGTVIATDGSFRGSISATNGYFSGEINASDIILNGHALKFSANGNTFLIQDGDISVDYITTTESMQGLEFNGRQTDSNGMKSGWTYHEFDVTGTTTINFPPMRGRVSGWYSNPDGQQQSSPGTIWSEICYYLLNDDQLENFSWGNQKVASGSYMYGNSGSTANSVSNTGSIEGNDLYVGLTGGSSSNSTASIQLQEGHYVIYVTYMIDTPATVWDTGNWNQVNAVLYESTFINTPNTVDTQFFRIGRNGLQCFMPGGYSFTAANRKSGTETGPVISLIGANGTCGLKIDSNGIKIKRNSNEGWRDIAVS